MGCEQTEWGNNQVCEKTHGGRRQEQIEHHEVIRIIATGSVSHFAAYQRVHVFILTERFNSKSDT